MARTVVAMSPGRTDGRPDMDPTSVIVTGHLLVAAEGRDAYLATCVAVVEAARATPGCLDFALSPDLVDPGRINILERWASQAAVDAFRGEGVEDEQGALIVGAAVSEYDVAGARSLTG